MLSGNAADAGARRKKKSTAAGQSKILFRLYVARGEPSSQRALFNLISICEHHIDNCEIEVVDLTMDFPRAEIDGIAEAPTLVKVSPPPAWSVVGDLSEEASILAMMQGPPTPRREK